MLEPCFETLRPSQFQALSTLRLGKISAQNELDTIQSEYTEEPSSPHSPSPTSVALVRDIDDLLDASAPRAPRKLDHYYAAPTRSKSCCVIA